MKQKVSVIITVLNEVNSVKILLEKLLLQSRKPDEIVIVDGFSTDGTIERIREISEQEKCVKLIIKKGVNISQGRNMAIRCAQHHLIAATDGGCQPETKWLEKLIEPFESDPSIDAVKGVYKPYWHNLLEFYCGISMLPGTLEEIKRDEYPMTGRSSAFKKSLWEIARGYPEWLYTAEDSLFEEKLKRMGANIKLAKHSIVHWRPRKSLWKMGKMFYLYGRGAGRIGKSIKGAHYHLRNYLLGVVLLVLSFFYPLTLLLFAVGVAYIYKGYYRPIVRRIKKVYPGWKAEFYIPLIVFVRSLSYSIGLLVGNYEYKHVPAFKENLESYLSAPFASLR
ncbi:MAG: glycosyltransferase [Deltaproteobacteria bacterium]|nr:glycosyltransferase [Deltaproteobacteria bacterium]